MKTKMKSKPIKSADKRNQPIAVDISTEMQTRKDEKGISIHRSLDDALRFALRPENRQLWW